MTDKSKLAISLAHHVMTSVGEHHPMPEHRPLAAEHLDVSRARSLALREIARALVARADSLEGTSTRLRVSWLEAV